MEEGTECPECHEKAVKKCEITDQIICRSCGTMVVDKDDQFETTDVTNYGKDSYDSKNIHSNIPFNTRKELYVSKAPAIKEAIEKIKLLNTKLKFSSIIQANSIELFEKVAAHPQFKCIRLESKEALAASCYYIILRQNNYPVTKSLICDTVLVRFGLFNSLLNAVLSLFDIEICTMPIEDFITSYFSSYRGNDKQEIVDKTTKIIFLARKVWLSESRKPQCVISACAYIAWISRDISNRIKVKYNSFCEGNKFQIYPSSLKRIKELFDMIKKLSEQLPWVDKKQLKKKIYLLSCLDKVLNMSNLLLSLTVCSEDGNETRNTFRPPPSKKIKKEFEDIQVDLPVENVSLLPELTDADLPDEDLRHYIRSEEEVEDLKLFTMKHEIEK